MTLATVAILTWGFVLGLILRPFVTFVIGRVSNVMNNSAVGQVAGALIATSSFGLILIGSLWLAGVLPLRGLYPLFGLALLSGALMFKVLVEGIHRKAA